MLGLSRDLTCADSCFDSWINFPASTIKRAVFLFSSSTLHRNKADSSSCCDLADNPRAVEQHRLASDANHQIAQETDAQRHDGGGMCKRLLESNTRKVRSHNRASDGSGSV